MESKKKSKLIGNPVNHPRHYTSHPSGIEAIEICGRMHYNTGCAFKYLYRLDKKWDSLEDLRKTRWYINREGFQIDSEFTFYTPYLMSQANAFFENSIQNRVAPDSNIAKVVKATPGNVGKAILFVFLADKLKELKGFHDSEIAASILSYLLHAKTFVQAEIRKRVRAQKVGKR